MYVFVKCVVFKLVTYHFINVLQSYTDIDVTLILKNYAIFFKFF